MYAIFAITRFTLLEAIRSRLAWLLLIVLAVAMLLAEFIGGLAITESLAIKTSLLAAGLRLIAIFLISLYVCSSMLREINDKGMELTLALPISRAQYYFGKLTGFALIAFFSVLMIGFCLSFYAPLSQLLIWMISLYCELLIIIAMSLLCIYSFSQLTIAISAVAAFYLLARSIDSIQLLGQGSLSATGSSLQIFISKSVDGLAFLLPDLYRYSLSEWLIYAETSVNQILPILIQTLIFVSVLISAGLFDLYRKNI